MQVNVELVRQLRRELRAMLPELQPGRMVSNETLSACLGLLAEATMIRMIQEIQLLRGTQIKATEAKNLMEEVHKALADSIGAVVLKHVPDATIFQAFKSP
jgi:hypothetical protein